MFISSCHKYMPSRPLLISPIRRVTSSSRPVYLKVSSSHLVVSSFLTYCLVVPLLVYSSTRRITFLKTEKDKRYPRQGLRSRKWTGWTELILFIYFFFVRLFLHIIIYYDNCFNYYVLLTLFLLVNTFLLILHVFNIAFIVISSIFIKRLKNI